MACLPFTSLEPLEARIAPAGLAIFHPLVDLTPTQGKTGATIDLAASFDEDPAAGYRTHVVFITNFDTDPGTPGLQAGRIVLELFDEKAPLTVQNFLTYLGQGSGHDGYVGTYFHRSVDQPASEANPQNLQILQGGGYKASAPTTAIKTGPTVHNEYDPNDAERQNVEGTIALAKKGGDPNSGANEFFFNLGDNSQTLNGANNGGFTVFGRIVSGLGVAEAIGKLPTTTLAGPSPYQNNYQSDPDGDPSTPAPTPKVNQLVAITGAKIVPAKNSAEPGLHFSLVSITDSSSGLPTHLVTGAVTGDRLALHYTPGASGVAEVTVRASAGGESVTESFQVHLTPNLLATGVTDGFLPALQGGDTAQESVKLTNAGGGTARGQVTVDYYLSAVSESDPNGSQLDSSDLQVGSFATPGVIAIASGQSKTISGQLSLSAADLQNLASGTYRLIGQFSSAGDTASDFFTDDNAITGSLHSYFAGARQADLSVTKIQNTLPRILVPGDAAVARVTITNAAQETAAGLVDVQFYLGNQASTAAHPLPDLPVGGLTSVSLDLAGGDTLTIAAPISVPASLANAAGFYQLHAAVTPSASGGVTDLQAANDTAYTTANYGLLNQFGRVSLSGVVRHGAVLKYTDPEGHLVSLRLTGPGSGAASADPATGVSVLVEGTTAASTLSLGLTSTDGSTLPAATHTVLSDVLVSSQTGAFLGTLGMGRADFSDAVTLLGGVGRLALGGTSGSGDHFVSIGTPAAGAGARPIITLGALQDTSLTSTVAIATLTTGPWLSVNGHGQALEAPGIATLHVQGDLAADLTLTPKAVTGADVLGQLAVDGSLTGATIMVNGNVGQVRLGSIAHSAFLVGASVVPQTASDFYGAFRVGSFRVTGGDGATTFGVTASDIAAARFTTLALSSVDPDHGGQAFGVAAENIATYQRGPVIQHHLTSASPADGEGDYTVRLLAPRT